MIAERIAWVAADPAALRVLELAHKVADTPTTLLVTGETGTGKDHLARLVHELGSRRDAPYLKIDCASLPQELVESELFGHERGAFTGAVERKLGRLELAGGGTIVLDEVAALAPSIQSKLLRVLEERSFERLGGTETLRIEARLVALTNADLAKAVATGRFREDLYFRLNVLTLTVPPLRERPADILPLAEHLLARLAPVHGRPDALLVDEAQRMLLAYAWPGNVRELENAIERAVILATGDVLDVADVAGPRPHVQSSLTTFTGDVVPTLDELERAHILKVLELCDNQKTKAAQMLGINRTTLWKKLRQYGLDAE